MEELRRSAQGGSGSADGPPSEGGGSGGVATNAEEEVRASMMSQILQPAARERLNRINLVRPDRAKQVQELLIRMGQTGQLQQKVSESDLVSLLNQISNVDSAQLRLVIQRRDSESDSGFDAGDSKLGGSYNPEKPAEEEEDEDDDFFD